MAKAAADAAGSLHKLMNGGVLGLVVEAARGGQNYQALVEASGDTLATALERYFTQSEQLATRLCFAGADDRLRGLLIQRLPARDGDEDAEHWQHLQTLFATLSPDELATTPTSDLLLKLFPGEDIRVFRSKPVALVCRCSHASISAMLVSLGRKELEGLVRERGEVEVTCEFCGKSYRYSVVEMQKLFEATEAKARDVTRH
jgi:molecular chaperone Hsp33